MFTKNILCDQPEYRLPSNTLAYFSKFLSNSKTHTLYPLWVYSIEKPQFGNNIYDNYSDFFGDY